MSKPVPAIINKRFKREPWQPGKTVIRLKTPTEFMPELLGQ